MLFAVPFNQGNSLGINLSLLLFIVCQLILLLRLLIVCRCHHLLVIVVGLHRIAWFCGWVIGEKTRSRCLKLIVILFGDFCLTRRKYLLKVGKVVQTRRNWSLTC